MFVQTAEVGYEISKNPDSKSWKANDEYNLYCFVIKTIN